jgi:large subunit ribosomal protein L15
MFKKEYNIINISDLATLAKSWVKEINKEVLLEKRIIRKKNLWVKLLANWELKEKITVKVNKASKKATELIEKLGGKLEIIT